MSQNSVLSLQMAEQEGDEKFYGIPLEDLDESDIDDEDGDLVTVQHVTLNNKVSVLFSPRKWIPINLARSGGIDSYQERFSIQGQIAFRRAFSHQPRACSCHGRV